MPLNLENFPFSERGKATKNMKESEEDANGVDSEEMAHMRHHTGI